MPQANSIEVQNVTGKRLAAGTVWRWRTELGSLTGGSCGFAESVHVIGLIPAAVLTGLVVVAALVLPWPRRFLAARLRCVLTRHRLQSVFWELRYHTRAYRIPLVLWIRPTPAGERAWVFARAGLCAEDFTKATLEIATACIARDARIAVSARFAALITIDVIRRDVLGPRNVIRSPLAALADHPEPVTVPGDSGPSWPQQPWTGERS